MTQVMHGDVLLRVFTAASFQLVDAVTRHQLAIVPSVDVAIIIAADRGGAVWRENIDAGGRPLGEPVLVWPSVAHTVGKGRWD